MKKLVLENFNENKEQNKKDVAELAMSVMQTQQECELRCVTKVLTQYLQREPKEEDFKNCIRMYEDNKENPDKYILCYRNVKLGLIKHVTHFNMGDTKFSVEFNPDIIEFQKK